MAPVVVLCLLLVRATCVLHYEVLRALHVGLPRLGIPARLKLLVVILTTFVAHAAEIVLYGAALYGLVSWFSAGSLNSGAGFSLASCMYFPAEAFTSLGLGDFTPVGPVRLLAGVEALNGLLLIAWSESFTFLSMARFWRNGQPP
jgi:Ion channel